MSQVILGHKTLKFIKGYYFAPVAPPFNALVAIDDILANIISGTDEPLNQNILNQIQSSNQDFTDINAQLEEIILSGYDPLERLKNYLTIEALEDGLTAKLSVNNCQYSFDALNWVDLPAATPTPSINKGQKLYFKGNLTPENDIGIGTFAISKKCNLLGNCNSMLVGDDAKSTLSLKKYRFAFYKLFSNCSTIIDASQLKLPATTLAESCYDHMFSWCTSLVSAPTLPATKLAEHCYRYMFWGCTSLTTAPELPATTLADWCYSYMFYGCTSLVTAPSILPATTLTNYCYYEMFYGCTSLVSGPELPASKLTPHCYSDMFRNCTSLVTAPALPATTLAEWCYFGMFYGCTSLVAAPELPSRTSGDGCYSYMFYGCTSLVTAPSILPATTLTNYCYDGMFQDCTSLTTAPELPATTLAGRCYEGMFEGCSKLNYIKALFTTTPSLTYTQNWVTGVSSTGTFVKNKNATWNVPGNNGIPTGWAVQTV